MENSRKIGIWMDHSEAEFIGLSSVHHPDIIPSDFNFAQKEAILRRSEKSMHNKEQQKHDLFYKEIGNKLMKYDHVLLFGPTSAKSELHNFLEKDAHFKNVKFDVVPADKMTENEKYAFVKDHFNA